MVATCGGGGAATAATGLASSPTCGPVGAAGSGAADSDGTSVGEVATGGGACTTVGSELTLNESEEGEGKYKNYNQSALFAPHCKQHTGVLPAHPYQPIIAYLILRSCLILLFPYADSGIANQFSDYGGRK